MNIAHIEERSYVNGPGCRFVIWTQGCSIRCKGCANRSMWDSRPNRVIPAEALFESILAGRPALEGLTLSGGEPLDQYGETLTLLELCADRGISAMVYTGYQTGQITEKGMARLFDLADILITGPYEEDKRTLNRQWTGSTNQQIHFLSSRYKDYAPQDANYVEVSLDAAGGLAVTGFPPIDAGMMT
ncbi:MAG: radical SAM protein [Treponema sp.]|jgi:anaerobic ribonucleoside-triphosphate reductase activating protein|nr:radical SAM protein [Treponema sp.]